MHLIYIKYCTVKKEIKKTIVSILRLRFCLCRLYAFSEKTTLPLYGYSYLGSRFLKNNIIKTAKSLV